MYLYKTIVYVNFELRQHPITQLAVYETPPKMAERTLFRISSSVSRGPPSSSLLACDAGSAPCACPIRDDDDFGGTPGFAARFGEHFSGWDFTLYGAYVNETSRVVSFVTPHTGNLHLSSISAPVSSFKYSGFSRTSQHPMGLDSVIGGSNVKVGLAVRTSDRRSPITLPLDLKRRTRKPTKPTSDFWRPQSGGQPTQRTRSPLWAQQHDRTKTGIGGDSG